MTDDDDVHADAFLSLIPESSEVTEVMARSGHGDIIDFPALERELQGALEAEERYTRENEAKLRAVHQKVASYSEFR